MGKINPKSRENGVALRFSKNCSFTHIIFIIVIVISFAVLCCARPAMAQISVDNVILRFNAGQRPVQNVSVRNNSSKVAYVNVEADSIDGTGKEQKAEKTKDLLVSPRAFTIEPNGTRTVRVLLQGQPTDSERIFRVSFIPQDREFGEEYHVKQKGISAVIRVLSGMGILVFADPASPHVKLDWTRTGDQLVFKNSGNVNIYLTEGTACPPNVDKDKKLDSVQSPVAPGDKPLIRQPACLKLQTKRLYAGQDLVQSIPNSSTVVYLRSDGGVAEYQRLIIPPGDGNAS